MIFTKTDHDIIHKTENQGMKIDTEIIPSLHIGITAVTPILNNYTEATQQRIKDKLIKYNQTKKQLQTPQVFITQKITNYN